MRTTIIVLSLMLMAGCQRSDPLADDTKPTDATALHSDVLKQLFRPDMIGAQVPFVERLAGPAWKIQDSASPDTKWRLYKIGPCVAEVAAQGQVITGLAMAVSPQCTFPVKPFAPNSEFPAADQLTFGHLDPSTIRADCLYSCGNGWVPFVHSTWQGSQADGNRLIRVSAPTNDARVLEALEPWEAAMLEAKGEDWMISAGYNCTREFQNLATRATQTIRAHRVQIEGPLPEFSC